MVAYTCNSSTCEAEEGLKFKANLTYIGSSCLKKTKEREKPGRKKDFKAERGTK
jgi:hypothetical protein